MPITFTLEAAADAMVDLANVESRVWDLKMDAAKAVVEQFDAWKRTLPRNERANGIRTFVDHVAATFNVGIGFQDIRRAVVVYTAKGEAAAKAKKYLTETREPTIRGCCDAIEFKAPPVVKLTRAQQVTVATEAEKLQKLLNKIGDVNVRKAVLKSLTAR